MALLDCMAIVGGVLFFFIVVVVISNFELLWWLLAILFCIFGVGSILVFLLRLFQHLTGA